MYLCLFCSTPFHFLYFFGGGSTSTCVYLVELNKCISNIFYLMVLVVFSYFTAEWLLMFSPYLLILQFEASALMMAVHEVSRNVT